MLVRHARVTLLFVLSTGMWACGMDAPSGGASRSGSGTAPPAQQWSFQVNATLRPDPGVVLDPHADGTPRPVARITSAAGVDAHFIERELIVSAEASALDAFLQRWNGTLVRKLDTGPEFLGDYYVVRIDTALAVPTNLERDLTRLNHESDVLGDTFALSSEDGLALLAAAVSEAADGVALSVNWISAPVDFRSRTTSEATSSGAFSGDAYRWGYMRDPGPSGGFTFGAAEAWRYLSLAGKFGNRVKIAVVDAGFDVTLDTPGKWEAYSVIRGAPPLGVTGMRSDWSATWHGSEVVQSAMAVPDNGFGVAGPAGPVADAVMVLTGNTFDSNLEAFNKAVASGAKIINMSFGALVSSSFGGVTRSFADACQKARDNGIMVVAAAGNNGVNLDANSKSKSFFPCEFNGVFCIGAVNSSATTVGNQLESYSNFGSSIEIYGPAPLWARDPRDGSITTIAGTSFATPYVAGVFGLMLAANPALTPDELRLRLLDSANVSTTVTGLSWARVVDASAAVAAALEKDLPPVLSVSASPAGLVDRGAVVQLVASAEDAECRSDGAGCSLILWSSSNAADQGFGYGTAIKYVAFASPGPRTVTASYTDSAGHTASAAVVVNVSAAPVVTIHSPTDGAFVDLGAPTYLEGVASDVNEATGELFCTSLAWTSSAAEDVIDTGCAAWVTFATEGERMLTLMATDPQGHVSSTTTTVVVVNSAPTVIIHQPLESSTVAMGATLNLDGSATDINSGELPCSTLVWTSSDPSDGVGSGCDAIVSFNSPGPRLLRLTAVDPQGKEGTATVEIVVTDAPQLSLSDFSPKRGSADTTVVIVGTGFSATTTDTMVTFNGVAASVLTASPTSLTVAVPASTSGPIEIHVGGSVVTSAQPFLFSNTTPIRFSPRSVVRDHTGAHHVVYMMGNQLIHRHYESGQPVEVVAVDASALRAQGQLGFDSSVTEYLLAINSQDVMFLLFAVYEGSGGALPVRDTGTPYLMRYQPGEGWSQPIDVRGGLFSSIASDEHTEFHEGFDMVVDANDHIHVAVSYYGYWANKTHLAYYQWDAAASTVLKQAILFESWSSAPALFVAPSGAVHLVHDAYYAGNPLYHRSSTDEGESWSSEAFGSGHRIWGDKVLGLAVVEGNETTIYVGQGGSDGMEILSKHGASAWQQELFGSSAPAHRPILTLTDAGPVAHWVGAIGSELPRIQQVTKGVDGWGAAEDVDGLPGYSVRTFGFDGEKLVWAADDGGTPADFQLGD